MRLSSILWAVAQFLYIPAIIGLLYVYFYPAVQLCSFPDAKPAEAACYFDETKRPAVPSEEAPFRLLAFGDPQLEGDTSLPDPNAPAFPSISTLWAGDVGGALNGFLKSDVPKTLQAYRKRLDLWGNDRYLAHVYRLVKWWTIPTHMVVLGDLLGSQWIGDDEFQRRTTRFWRTVFKGAQRVPDSLTGSSGRSEVLGADDSWSSRLIAVAGNHDIGYAGDINQDRMARFEKAYGGANWDIRFRLNDSRVSASSMPQTQAFGGSRGLLAPAVPELRVVVLNSMNLDGPALTPELQEQSLGFMRQQLAEQQLPLTTGTVLLTHIPLHKPAGVCVDGPLFNYHEPQHGGGIREQNHLSPEISAEILDGLMGADRQHQAVILNGHDHWGCDIYHYMTSSPGSTGDGNDAEVAAASKDVWNARHFRRAVFEKLVANESIAGLREITARSMMGSYAGNALLLSAWFDRDEARWKFDYSACLMGVQHLWWGVHVFAIVVLGLGLASVAAAVYEALAEERAAQHESASKAKLKAT